MEKEVRNLKCPDLYMGESFEDGYKGCRIMVIGHQGPKTAGDEDKFKIDSERTNLKRVIKTTILGSYPKRRHLRGRI